ncbi:hypothetical protein AAVH_27804 [Aphelenchoides avenae]|nr:hypothetical protein AAVH_27804 [Aphelenchus avenae]
METTVPSSATEATTFGPEVMTAHPPLRIFGASSYALLSSLSIALNSALITILVKGHQKYRKVPFFVITWNLVIGDVFAQSVQLLMAVPITYAGYPIYGETLILYAPAFLDTIAYNVTLAFSFYWGYVTTYLPIAMLAMYVIIYVHLRYVTTCGRKLQTYRRRSVIEKAQERLRSKGEVQMLLQSFIICGMLEVQNLAFNYLPVLGLSGQWEYVVNFVENWISILLNTTTPVIIFTFNSEIRSRLKEMLGLRPAHEARRKATTVMPMQATVVFASTSAFQIRIE